jgi:hypothetical protein
MSMADDLEDVRCFQVTIFLSTDNPVVGATFFAAAGNNHDEVVQQPPRFQTSELERAKTVCIQLLEKLAKAISTEAETIKIYVSNGGIILPDPEPTEIATRAIAAPKPKLATTKFNSKAPRKAVTPKVEKKINRKKQPRETKKSEQKKPLKRGSKTDAKKKTEPQTKTADHKKTVVKQQSVAKTKVVPTRKNKKPDRNL